MTLAKEVAKVQGASWRIQNNDLPTRKCRARYKRVPQKDGMNLFGLRFSAQLPDNADVVADITTKKFLMSEVKAMAKAATPEGYEFIGIEKVKDF